MIANRKKREIFTIVFIYSKYNKFSQRKHTMMLALCIFGADIVPIIC